MYSMDEIKLGIVGYTEKDFDEKVARQAIKHFITTLRDNGQKPIIVIGVSNMGIDKIAYDIAEEENLRTVGISPKEVENYELLDVDKKIIKGEKFGDESEYYIDYIDKLIKVGGGEQSEREYNLAVSKLGEKNVKEYNIQ